MHTPSKNNLGGGLTVLGSEAADSRLVKARVRDGCATELYVGRRTKVAEGHRLNSMFPRETKKLLLGVVRVQFYLKHRRLHFAILQDLCQHASTDVANANITYKTLRNELLHRLVSHLISDALSEFHTGLSNGWIVEPLWWISRLDWHELLRNREVNQIEIQIVQSEILQGFLNSQLDVVWMMEGVPKLRDDKEIAALYFTGCKHTA